VICEARQRSLTRTGKAKTLPTVALLGARCRQQLHTPVFTLELWRFSLVID